MKNLVSIPFVVLFVCSATYMQVPNMQILKFDLNEIRLVETNDARWDEVGTPMIAEYLVADKDLRLTEVRLEDAKAANKMLKLRLTLLGTCKFLKKLHYNGKKSGAIIRVYEA